MYYSSIGLISFIIIFVLNHELLLKHKSKPHSKGARLYKSFLLSVLTYLVFDVLWGFLSYFNAQTSLYLDTVLYFLSMFISVLAWTQYVIGYLEIKDHFRFILIWIGRITLVYEVFAVVSNFFYPVLFYFDENNKYVPGQARYFSFAIIFLMFFLTSLKALYIAIKTPRKRRTPSITIAFSGFVLVLFMLFQIFVPLFPFYATGCLIATCLIHIFVEEAEKRIFNEERDTYSHIADSLAEDFDAIYYIDIESGQYQQFSSSEQYASLEVPLRFEDFFEESRENVKQYVHPDDQEFAEALYYKDAMLKNLEGKNSYSYKYRLMVKGKPRYFSFTVFRADDNQHLVVCDKDVHDEMTAESARLKKQKDSLRALRTEKELARRDELTGVKNKTAYAELEASVQSNIDKGVDYLPFAIAVCDINDLKEKNDTEGHKAGDDYIKASSELICGIFAHSPVFRVGGDEFAVFIRGNDYSQRDALVSDFKNKVLSYLSDKSGPIVAIGMSEFIPGTDVSVCDVFQRADNSMYENKRSLKVL